MKNLNEKLLYKKWFLLSVFILLMNDFYLKYQFHNVITGKISDFAGLFAFPYLISLCTRRIKLTYFLTIIFFIYWKTEISESSISFFNSYGAHFYRVIDYTDFIAFLIIPFSYKYRKEAIFFKLNISKVTSVSIVLISCFSFIATSQRKIYRPPYVKELNVKSELNFQIPYSKEQIWDILGYKSLYLNNAYYFVLRDSNNVEVHYRVQLDEKNDSLTSIKLDSVLKIMYSTHYITISDSILKNKQANKYKNMTLKDFESIFVERITNVD